MKLYSADLVTISESLRNGTSDIMAYTDDVCSRLDEVEPEVRSLLPDQVHARLLRDSAALKERYEDPADPRPPLFGVPVGVKDLYRIDGFPTRAGSQLPEDLFAGPQASLVSKLQDLGAIVLGKTAMDEFAYAEPSPTRNPHNLSHTPGGSSSGSAAVVASGISPLSIGTQTSRSVIAPASFCGVVGYKPSFGRIPIDGVVYMSWSMDTVGFFTQGTDGMELAASLLVPNWSGEAPAHRPVLGIPEGIFMSYMSEAMREAFINRLGTLTRAGYRVRWVPMEWDAYIDDIYQSAMKLLHGEMARVHHEWVSAYRHLYRARTLQGIETGQQVTEDDLQACRDGQLSLRERLHDQMHEHGVDLWITPSQGATAPRGYETTGWGGMTTPWSYAGLPCISIPSGTMDGLPVGVQCIGHFGQDESLISWAKDIAKVLSSAPVR